MAHLKFLVIQQKMIGDVLTSTIICERLKTAYPNCDVHYVANHNTLAVLENNPNIDKIIVFEQKYRSNKLEFFEFLKSIQKESYHGVIDAYGKTESNLLSLFSRSEMKVSHYKWYTQWIYTNTVKENLFPNKETPLAIQNRLQLLNPLLGDTEKSVPSPKIYLTEKETESARTALQSVQSHQGQQLMMIGILGSSKIKTYPAEYMAEILDFICTLTDAKLLLNYIPKQKNEVLTIFEKCKKATQSRIAIDFYVSSLRDFLAVLSHCTAFVGNEGGAVNMAKALNIPTFSIFSPFIIKGAWHAENSKDNVGIHLMDYKPEVFEDLDKKGIKKNIDSLYEYFEPDLFKTSLSTFLLKNFNFQQAVSK